MEWMNDNCQLACATCRSNSAPSASLAHPPPRIQPTSPSVVHATNSFAKGPTSSSSRETSLKVPIQKQGTVQRGKVSSCIQIAEKTENAAEQLASSGLLQVVEDVTGRQILSLDDITRAVPSGCVPELNSIECSRSLCFHLAYRSMDASSNARRPTPREASRLLLASSQMNAHEQLNSDTNDAFRQKGCLKISRSVPVCGTGNPGRPREQLNENTAFVDGMLKMSSFNNLMVLPFDEGRCVSASSCSASFSAGDIRANLVGNIN
uniref:ShKT domain-containing protein n=1 Tax=Meloidogyne hapla TaxID=6305 RepID=A0A1I8BPL1_MELHA